MFLLLAQKNTSKKETSQKGYLSFKLPLNLSSKNAIDNLRPSKVLRVFEEPIDFTLDSTVPDPQPFKVKLRTLLDHNDDLIYKTKHCVGQTIL